MESRVDEALPMLAALKLFKTLVRGMEMIKETDMHAAFLKSMSTYGYFLTPIKKQLRRQIDDDLVPGIISATLMAVMLRRRRETHAWAKTICA